MEVYRGLGIAPSAFGAKQVIAGGRAAVFRVVASIVRRAGATRRTGAATRLRVFTPGDAVGLSFPDTLCRSLVPASSRAAACVFDGRRPAGVRGGNGPLLQGASAVAGIWRSLFPGDVVVGDRCFASYWDLALLAMCGVDSVYRQHQLRLSKRYRIRRLGSGDWLLRLSQPQRPSWMDHASYQRIPCELVVREVFFRVRIRGWRVRELTLAPTLCDVEVYSLEELARVYHARWQAQGDCAILSNLQ